jgi:hypothetical protein
MGPRIEGEEGKQKTSKFHNKLLDNRENVIRNQPSVQRLHTYHLTMQQAGSLSNGGSCAYLQGDLSPNTNSHLPLCKCLEPSLVMANRCASINPSRRAVFFPYLVWKLKVLTACMQSLLPIGQAGHTSTLSLSLSSPPDWVDLSKS